MRAADRFQLLSSICIAFELSRVELERVFARTIMVIEPSLTLAMDRARLDSFRAFAVQISLAERAEMPEAAVVWRNKGHLRVKDQERELNMDLILTLRAWNRRCARTRCPKPFVCRAPFAAAVARAAAAAADGADGCPRTPSSRTGSRRSWGRGARACGAA